MKNMGNSDAAIIKRLSGYVGMDYVPGRFDCADLAVLVQREVFGRSVALPTHPQGGATQRAAILRHRDALATRVDVPFTGCAVLFTDVNRKGDTTYHIGTAALHRGEVLVLHNSYETGGVRMDKLRDLLAWGMKLDGYYAWN